MAIRDKKRQLIENVELGGAPFFAGDFLNAQINASIDSKAFYDYLLSLSGKTQRYNSSSILLNEFKNGVFITPPTIDTTGGAAAAIVSPCLYYVNGEVVYFAGGTFDLSGFPAGVNALVLGSTKTNTSKVFKDGATKDMFEKVSAVVYPSAFTSYGLNFVSGLDYSKQYVVIQGTSANQTPAKILGLDTLNTRVTNLESKTTRTAWTQLVLSGGSGNIYYRLDSEGVVRLRGFAGLTIGSGTVTIATLPTGHRPAVNQFFLTGYNPTSKEKLEINVQTDGDIVLTKQSALTNHYFDGITFPTI